MMTASTVLTHACPGCDAPDVPHRHLACGPCWRRLPGDLRDAVLSSWRHRHGDPARHRAAVVGASTWYRHNPTP